MAGLGSERQGGSSSAPPDRPALTRGFLFSDLRGYTAFVETHGDRAAAGLLEAYRAAVRTAIASTGGAEVRTEGDSFYVVFASASAAVRCGLAIVESAAAMSATEPGRPIRVGVGIHAGESVEGPEGYVGSAVNIAARVCAQAAAGEVLVTDTVRSLVRTGLDVTFQARGRPPLKGIAEPIALYAVRAGSASVATADRGFAGRRRREAVAGLVAVASVALLLAVAAMGGLGSIGPVAPSGSGADVRSGSGAALSSAGSTARPSSSPFAGLPGRIAFIATQPIGSAVHQRAYLVDAAGGPRRLLSTLTEDVTGLTWAPTSGIVAFWTDPGGAPVVVDVDDPTVRRPWPGSWLSGSMTIAVRDKKGVNESYGLANVAWGSDGELIVASYGTWTDGVLDPDRSGIYRLSPDARSLTLVTRPDAAIRAEQLYDDLPVVSPDGATIVFRRFGPGSTATGAKTIDLWEAGLSGGGLAQVTEHLDVFSAAWSPDGSRVAFAGQPLGGGSIDIWVVGATASGLRKLTDDDASDRSPTFSPDGQWIAWSRTVGAQRQIWVMRSDGSDPHVLLAGEPGEQLDLPTWEPRP